MSSSKNRLPYGFSPEVMQEVERRSNRCCEQCHKRTTLEVHHRLGIGVARQHIEKYLGKKNTPKILTSIENAQALCGECHKRANESMFKDYMSIAMALVEIILTPEEQDRFRCKINNRRRD